MRRVIRDVTIAHHYIVLGIHEITGMVQPKGYRGELIKLKYYTPFMLKI